MYKLCLFAFVLCFTSIAKLSNGEGVCDDGWDQFHDDYYKICYKYFPDGLGDYQTVVAACKGEMNASLATINSQTEQNFLNKLIVKYKMIENLWLDASIKSKHIVWADSSSAEYENWIPGYPVNDSNCVEMVSEQAHLGKWQDIPCAKKNAYLCKRVVLWSDQRTERLIRDNRRLLEEYIARTVELEKDKVPIGFIYVQLPGQNEPIVLWPKYTWVDVTKDYAGQFFRAEGKGSLEFGKGLQSENAPRLTKVDYNYGQLGQRGTIDINTGEWSPYIVTGDGSALAHYAIRFLESAGEIRPLNQAVRIFKRTM